jgi:hypothetical protein
MMDTNKLVKKLIKQPAYGVNIAIQVLKEAGYELAAKAAQLEVDKVRFPWRHLPQFYAHEHTHNPILPIHVINGNRHYYPYEYNREERLCFGLVVDIETELAYFEEDILLNGTLDLTYTHKPLIEVCNEAHSR